MEQKRPAARVQQGFLHGAFILMFGVLLVKAIGALFKIPLSSIIAEDGMGYFSTAYSFFNVLFSLSTVGFPVAVARLTAADVLNDYAEERLADIFYLYGELKNARKLASWVVKARMHRRIETTEEFMEVVKPLFERDREKKELAKVFQALRIEVNQEMDALKEMLTAAVELLRPGGRLVVLTYHSLEDRMVKNLVKTGNVEGKRIQDFYGNVDCPLRAVHNKVIVPGEEEQRANPRSRSAKLRIAEKK